ncbi:hypothetical protein WG904_05655 [Pedobacter sp. Du54]|uniref:hypothetical protein n=1 Tax=Pedobacter anseongensis TaxID=3133439 RepID=UPI0030AFE67A
MEKNSFEDQLRNKILEAELTKNQISNQEKVWNAVQKKQPPMRKLYYVAAAILVIIGMVGALYFKHDEAIVAVKKTKTERPGVVSLQKPPVAELAKVKLPATPIKPVEIEKTILNKPEKRIAPMYNTKVLKEDTLSTVLPSAPEVVMAVTKELNKEIKVISIATAAIVPEFTVQFKRGKPFDAEEIQTIEAISRLKRFKLSKDTSVLANTNEKQKGFFKIKF